MNILLTGGSGFLGKNILQSSVLKKYRILAPSRAELNLLEEDSVKTFFFKNHVDVVIHAAGKPGHRNAPDRTNIFYSDMLMFLNLLRQADRYQRMIVLSSGAIYDQRYEIKKVSEEDYRLHLPVDEHALFRHVSANYIENSKKLVELRIFGIYGQYEDYAIRFISNAICKSLFGLPITIRQNRRFSYLYVQDLMPVLDYFIDCPKPKHCAYNLVPDESVELLELAKQVQAVAKTNIPISMAQPGMGLEYSGNNMRLKQELPDINFTSHQAAITELCAWYSVNQSAINKQLLLEDK